MPGVLSDREFIKYFIAYKYKVDIFLHGITCFWRKFWYSERLPYKWSPGPGLYDNFQKYANYKRTRCVTYPSLYRFLLNPNEYPMYP